MNKTFTRPFELQVKNAEDYGTALGQLYTKLTEVKKDISYLDIYNIVAACVNPDLFASQMNDLVPNSSLIINTNTFILNNETYEPGDVLLKLASGQVLHIKARTGGVFQPDEIIEKSDGNYTLRYKFTERIPEDGEGVEISGWKPEDGVGAYGYFGPVGESFAKIEDIKPFIKFYFVQKNGTLMEEVCCEYEIILDDDGIYTVNVEGFSAESSLYMLVK